jgi:hypothetical protein
MLIDKSYFVGELNIPGAGDEAVEDRLNYFIKIYEPELLRTLVGYELFKAFMAGYKTEQKYKDLLNGKEYTDSNGKLQKWDGLRIIDGSMKLSLVANYIYWFWQKDQFTLSSGVGEVKPKAKNAVSDSPANKMIAAWNKIQPWVCDLFTFLKENSDDYPEWDSTTQYAILEKFKPVNRFGI